MQIHSFIRHTPIILSNQHVSVKEVNSALFHGQPNHCPRGHWPHHILPHVPRNWRQKRIRTISASRPLCTLLPRNCILIQYSPPCSSRCSHFGRSIVTKTRPPMQKHCGRTLSNQDHTRNSAKLACSSRIISAWFWWETPAVFHGLTWIFETPFNRSIESVRPLGLLVWVPWEELVPLEIVPCYRNVGLYISNAPPEGTA